MSPEQARGFTTFLDERSDIYSLGTILYRALAGKNAFQGEPEQIIRDKYTDQTPSLRELEHGDQRLPTLSGTDVSQRFRQRKLIPEELIVICEKAMSYQPEASL